MRAVVSGIIGLFCILALFFVHAQNESDIVRKGELNQAVSNAAYQIVREVKEDQSVGINTKEEMIGAFMKSLFYQMNSDTQVTVSIIEADVEEGLLSVKVLGEYRGLNGSKKNIEVRKTVIYE